MKRKSTPPATNKQDSLSAISPLLDIPVLLPAPYEHPMYKRSRELEENNPDFWRKGPWLTTAEVMIIDIVDDDEDDEDHEPLVSEASSATRQGVERDFDVWKEKMKERLCSLRLEGIRTNLKHGEALEWRILGLLKETVPALAPYISTPTWLVITASSFYRDEWLNQQLFLVQ